MSEGAPQFHFYDKRLLMSGASRFLIRFISYFSYALLLALLIVGYLSEARWMNALAMLFTCFFIHTLFHINKPERALPRASLHHPNIRVYLTPATYRIIETAFDQAAFLGGDVVLRVFRLLLRRAEIKKALVRMDVSPADLLLKAEEYLSKQPGYHPSRKDLAGIIDRLVTAAFLSARNHFGGAVEPHDLFAGAALIGNDYVERLCMLFDIGPNDLETALIFGQSSQRRLTGFFNRTFKVRHRTMNRAWSARPTPTLDRFSVDITDQVRNGMSGFLIGHKQEYDRLVDVLSKPGNPNALLIGEPGSGKESIVHHLAFEIIHDRVPKPLFDRRIVSLEIGSLLAGAGEGEVEQRINKVLGEIMMGGNVILYIPDMHNLVKTTGSSRLSAADVLIPAIRSSGFSVIGASFPREFKQFIEPNTDFASSFDVIHTQEISEEEAAQFLTYQSLILEPQYGVTISFGAIKKAVSIAHKYFRAKLLPSSAEDLIKEALADASQNKKDSVGIDDIINIAQRKINVPLKSVAKDEAAELLNLEHIIHKKFIDQDEAVKAVSRSLREYRSGLSRKGGPIAVFLFVGPTGVGKTELSKMLAEIQFGSRDMMMRFDMTEYQDKQSFFRLIGSPDGEVRGTLTDAVLEKPYGLILLDEFEKAHPDVLNLFLQVFDDGRLTDNLGRTVNFENTIIIATSNAHSPYIKEEIEKATAVAKIAENLKRKLTDVFRPELLNRFSDIIVFKPLSQEDIVSIARLHLADLVEALKAAQAIDLEFSEEAIQEVAKKGFDPVFGARPLRNLISQKLRSVLAELILKGEAVKGSSLTCVIEGGEFVFKKS